MGQFCIKSAATELESAKARMVTRKQVFVCEDSVESEGPRRGMLRPFLFYGEDESDGAELNLFCGAGGGCGGRESDGESAGGRMKFIAGSGDGTGGITWGGGDGLDGGAGSVDGEGHGIEHASRVIRRI